MSEKGRILVVDDTESFRFLINRCLEDAGYEIICVTDGAAALVELEQSPFDLVISDLVMPEMDGVTLLRQARGLRPHLPFVLITAYGSIDGAVAAIKEGADDYLLKPLNWDELLLMVARLLKQHRVQVNYNRLLDLEREKFSFQNITTLSPCMAATLSAARQVAASPRTTIALLGESGVGKEVLARAIHNASGQDMSSFVAVNCAAIPETLLESELFGHVKGAFTSAHSNRDGKCCRAQGGTLFLDEIGDMPLLMQPKLLRLLEERVYEKIGSNRKMGADFRIIVATNHNLKECCAQGKFREDLYYRLTVFPITIPPLRDRPEDIPLLCDQLLDHFRHHQGKSLPGLSPEAHAQLMAHSWPGNVRELRNILEYATIITNGDLIRPEHLRLILPGPIPDPPATDRISLTFDFSPEEFSLEAATKQIVAWALQTCNNNKSSAARLLKAPRRLFY
jgi:DNA-binding NtrC family response regulator